MFESSDAGKKNDAIQFLRKQLSLFFDHQPVYADSVVHEDLFPSVLDQSLLTPKTVLEGHVHGQNIASSVTQKGLEWSLAHSLDLSEANLDEALGSLSRPGMSSTLCVCIRDMQRSTSY